MSNSSENGTSLEYLDPLRQTGFNLSALILQLSLYFTCIGGFIEALILIAFFYILKKNILPEIKKFIILLCVGYVIDFIGLLCWAIHQITNASTEFFKLATDITFVYTVSSGSIWHTVLFLNRATAVLLPLKHKHIWTLKKIYLVYTPAIILWPVFTNGYLIFDDRYYVEGLTFFSAKTNFFVINRIIIASIHLFAAVTMTVGATAIYIKFHLKNKELSQSWELVLLLHCIFTSALMTIFALVFLSPGILFWKNQRVAFGCEIAGILLYSIYHYGSIVLLLIVSRSIRKAIFNFYFGKIIDKIVELSSSIGNSNNAIVQQNGVSTF